MRAATDAAVARRAEARSHAPIPEPVAHVHVLRSHADFGGRDPTQTTTLRREWAGKFGSRYRTLRGMVREAVESKDIFGLDGPPGRPPVFTVQQQVPDSAREELNALRRRIMELYRQGKLGEAISELRSYVLHPGRFAFPQAAQKVALFRAWLDEAQDVVVAGVDGEWTHTYVKRAYLKGLTDAERRAMQAGLSVDDMDPSKVVLQPVHHDALQMLYTRSYQDLQGISAAAGTAISRELADGFAAGLNPKTMASAINKRLATVGLHRARTLARTEVIRAHAEATLSRYRQFGVKAVAGRAEFATAGDDRVCPICEGLDGEVFTLDDAKGVIPVHPNCRCTWLPVVESP